MTAHHPHEELLLEYASGVLHEASAVLVATHLALCPQCRRGLREAEAIGGVLLDELSPQPLGAQAFDAVMARLDEPAPFAPQLVEREATLPRPLRTYIPEGLTRLNWQPVAKGLRCYPLVADEHECLTLMHVEAGTAIPHHGHTGDEFTVVLDGGYSDASGRYRRGDVQCVGVDHSHRPLVDGDRPCVCLIVARGKVRLRNPLLRWFVRGLPF